MRGAGMENRVARRDHAENVGEGNQRADMKQVEFHKLAKSWRSAVFREAGAGAYLSGGATRSATASDGIALQTRLENAFKRNPRDPCRCPPRAPRHQASRR
ncbi:hypothetical protein BN2475_120139 [Paraburkholderia ribeironis]|uniref:Uncharacterized protein n=1 Tax=Paraburkholderia ribeironis TaxID=1247936 RepID=A0A1N7RRG3_9BURK|nr:hypothetical protein BN2475_120139 [Paraburkholderia ribeironis]